MAPLAAIADELVARLRPRVAHNDAQLANFLFRGDDAVCLVDLDTVMPTAWFWDVGDLLRSAVDGKSGGRCRRRAQRGRSRARRAPSVDGYRAGVSGAVEAGTAEDDALDVAGALITYEQALRFLTDFDHGRRLLPHDTSRSEPRPRPRAARPARVVAGYASERDGVARARPFRPAGDRGALPARRGRLTLDRRARGCAVHARATGDSSRRPDRRRGGDGRRQRRRVPPAARRRPRRAGPWPRARARARRPTPTHARAGTRRSPRAADAPFFLWAGVPSTEIGLLCLLERHHYERVETNFDMTIDLDAVHRRSRRAMRSRRPRIAPRSRRSWRRTGRTGRPRCCARSTRATSSSRATRDGISAFCAFEVNRSGFPRPGRGASRPHRAGRRAARRSSARCTSSGAAAGRASRSRGSGPIVPYARLGGRVSTVYFVYRKELS